MKPALSTTELTYRLDDGVCVIVTESYDWRGDRRRIIGRALSLRIDGYEGKVCLGNDGRAVAIARAILDALGCEP